MDPFLIGSKPRTVLSYFLEDAGVPTLAPSRVAPSAVHRSIEEPVVPRIAIEIFCDGACVNNGRRGARAGYGIVARRDGGEVMVVSEPLRPEESQTNQRAELRALLGAVQFACTASASGATTIRIYTDSEYAIHCVTKWVTGWRRSGWRRADGGAVLHRDILEPLTTAWDSLRGVAFLTHVRAHTGRGDAISLGNARADELARASLTHNRGLY